jgi:hypothetical protein
MLDGLLLLVEDRPENGRPVSLTVLRVGGGMARSPAAAAQLQIEIGRWVHGSPWDDRSATCNAAPVQLSRSSIGATRKLMAFYSRLSD